MNEVLVENTEAKGETTMNNTNENNTKTKKPFNVFNYTKKLLCIEYLKNKEKDFTVNVKYWNDYKENGYNISGAKPVFYTLARDGGIQSYEVKEIAKPTENGKVEYSYEVKVTGFNPKAKGTSKAGKPYDLFLYAMKDVLYYQQFANNEVTA